MWCSCGRPATRGNSNQNVNSSNKALYVMFVNGGSVYSCWRPATGGDVFVMVTDTGCFASKPSLLQ
jgi:hypothetical protein